MTKCGNRNGPNKELRGQRLSRGWSLDDLAAAVVEVGKQVGEPSLALTAKTVGRWERGESNPRAPYPKLLCALFMTSAEELGLRGDGSSLTSAMTVSGALYARSDPRVILGALGSGLVDPMGRTHRLEGGHLYLESTAPRGMDTASAELIAKALGTLRRLNDRLGAPAVARPALELRSLVEHFGQFPLGEGVRARLRSVAAELSQFLGWLAYDATDHSTARAYYQEGLHSARQGANQDLVFYLLGHIATLAVSEGKLAEAVSVIDSQIDRIAKSACHLTRSWFAAIEAKIRAVAGDDTACRAALERSRKAFDRARYAEAPTWLYFFDRAELMAYEGACCERIGQLDLARDTWELALSSLSEDRIRDRAKYLVHLASIYARQGEIETACQMAGEALAVAVETGSVRAKEQIEKLRMQLDSWKETRAVRDFDHQLTLVR